MKLPSAHAATNTILAALVGLLGWHELRPQPKADPAPVTPAPAPAAPVPPPAPVTPAPPETIDPEDLAAVTAAYRHHLAAYYAWASDRVGGFAPLTRQEIEAAEQRLERPFAYAQRRSLDRYYDDKGGLGNDRSGFVAAYAAVAKALEQP